MRGVIQPQWTLISLKYSMPSLPAFTDKVSHTSVHRSTAQGVEELLAVDEYH